VKPSQGLELHEHSFTSGPRSRARYDGSGKWVETTFTHSHAGGGVPHKHPNTGPSGFAYYKGKFTKRPSGEQFELVPLTEDESTFELVITDSAITYDDDWNKIPIGNTPIEEICMPAADRMVRGHRLRCIVRDERTGAGL
jgi:hypothetical protein